MPADCCQLKYHIRFALTVMMGANEEPENGQFSKEKFHGTKTFVAAFIFFFPRSLSQVDGYCSSVDLSKQ